MEDKGEGTQTGGKDIRLEILMILDLMLDEELEDNPNQTTWLGRQPKCLMDWSMWHSNVKKKKYQQGDCGDCLHLYSKNQTMLPQTSFEVKANL